MVIRYRGIQYTFDACKLFDIGEIKIFQIELLEWYISTTNQKYEIVYYYKI